MSVSPLVNTNRKGGAFPIILQQFRRAVRVTIGRGNINHNLGKVHYMRGTAETAANTCKINHNNYICRPSQKGGYSWCILLIPQRGIPPSISSRMDMIFGSQKNNTDWSNAKKKKRNNRKTQTEIYAFDT